MPEQQDRQQQQDAPAAAASAAANQHQHHQHQQQQDAPAAAASAADPQQHRQQQHHHQQQYRQPWGGGAERFLYAGLANAVSGVATNPVDVLKVRRQVWRGAASGPAPSLRGIVAAEGPGALMAGWQASVMREMSYSAIRLGLYDEMKGVLAGAGDAASSFPFWKKLVAGGVSGALGASLANPTDLMKIRAQALDPATGKPFYSYPNPWTAIGAIYRQEGGLAALYRGVVPTTQRAIILTATQLAVYDEIKWQLLGSGLLREGVVLHLVSSTLAGLAVATTTNPVDLVKSRYMNQQFDPATNRGLQYTGVGDCLRKTVASEGLGALYNGWTANWLRIGPHTVITLIIFEAMRKAAGLAPV